MRKNIIFTEGLEKLYVLKSCWCLECVWGCLCVYMYVARLITNMAISSSISILVHCSSLCDARSLTCAQSRLMHTCTKSNTLLHFLTGLLWVPHLQIHLYLIIRNLRGPAPISNLLHQTAACFCNKPPPSNDLTLTLTHANTQLHHPSDIYRHTHFHWDIHHRGDSYRDNRHKLASLHYAKRGRYN